VPPLAPALDESRAATQTSDVFPQFPYREWLRADTVVLFGVIERKVKPWIFD
jgi:hypothetical protein